MADKDLILAKAGAVIRHLNRIREKRSADLRIFMADVDQQEIILFNIQMAIQNCIDMASHIISKDGMGVPGSYTEMFYLLEENGYITAEITENMVKAVGFRNLMVHEYSQIDLKRVFEIAAAGPEDINRFLRSLFAKLGIASEENGENKG